MRLRSVVTTAALAAVTLSGICGVSLIADDDTDAQIAKLRKQTDLINAQKAKLDAESGLAAAKASADLQSQKSIADVEKSLSEAQTQAWIARNIGTVAAGPYNGSVTTNDKAGSLEALLLASKALRSCTHQLVGSVREKLCPGSPATCSGTVLVYRESEVPTFATLGAFNVRAPQTEEALRLAIDKAKTAQRNIKIAPTEVAPLPVIAAAMMAVGNIAAFLKTDTTVAGVEAKLDEAALLNTVAGALASPSMTVIAPRLYVRPSGASLDAILKTINKLYALRADAVARLEGFNVRIASETAEAAAAKKEGEKAAHQKIVDTLRPAVSDLAGAIATYDALFTYLTTADSKGAIPLVTLAQEHTIDSTLRGGASMLLIRLEATGGGSLVKKNLLTGLGAMPLYHMGGAAVSYVLLSGADGKVIGGDAIPVFGGYTRTDKLAKELEE